MAKMNFGKPHGQVLVKASAEKVWKPQKNKRFLSERRRVEASQLETAYPAKSFA